MNPDAIKQASAALAALDFSAENLRIAELRADIDRAESAIELAEQRCTEIARARHEYTRPDGRAIGDALLADIDVSAAAMVGPNLQALEAEQAGLREGIRDLHARSTNARYEIDNVQAGARATAAQAIKPVVEALHADAVEAAGVLAAAYASLYAIEFGFRTAQSELYEVSAAVRGVAGPDLLLTARRAQDVAPEVIAIVRAAGAKGEALPARIVERAPLP